MELENETLDIIDNLLDDYIIENKLGLPLAKDLPKEKRKPYLNTRIIKEKRPDKKFRR